jgi:Carboxypeptidase regulatory-like domain/TonB dependent receptor
VKQRTGVSLLVLLFFSTICRAQSPTAVVNGQVRDASGAAVAGATVEVFNDATRVRYATETNEEGIYSVPDLPPGTYHIQVSKQGFKTVIHPDITLNVQDAKAIGFTLPVGPVSDTVTVEGGTSMINTVDASVSTIVDQTYVKNMPLNGRSFQDLILLAPGIVTNSPQPVSTANGAVSGLGTSGEFSVNGQRTESNYYTVDGVSANIGVAPGQSMTFGGSASGSVAAATALGTTQALVSVDDLQEFRVQTSTYSAEYGRNPGGQIAFETKSGTNRWHGTAFDYLRNNYFDANDWFNDYFGVKEPALRQNDFGGTVGGPVQIRHVYNGKDKTFFFVSYEGLRLLQPQAATATYVPDLCMRATGPCPVGRNPAASALLPVLKAFPDPSPNGLEDPTNGFGQFIGSWSNPSSLDSASARVDQVVNDRLKLFFRFSNTSSSSATRAANGGAVSQTTTEAYTARTYTGGATALFTNQLSNELRLNYSSNLVSSDTGIDSFGGNTPANLGQLMGLPGSSPVLCFCYAGQTVGFDAFNQRGAQRQWNLVDALSLSFGRHQLKFGGDYRRLAPFAIPPNPEVDFFYFSENSVETNSAFTLPTALAPAYPLYTNYSAFAQDQWKVSQRLSLSIGLRWDVNPAPSVTQGLMPYTLQGTSLNTFALAPQGTPLWQTAWYNIAPRLGAAYILRNVPGMETVMRVGGGLFYDTGQQLGSQGFNGPGFQSVGAFQPGAFPVAPPIPAITNPPTSGTNVYWFPAHLQLPYTLQWNLSLEQALGKSQTLTASYVGSHAARLLKLESINPPNNPNVSYFWAIENGLTSDYDSLQVQFRRRLSDGLTALASYTLSHCLDYGSQNYLFGYQRGNCDFDIRDNFSGAFSYDIPPVETNRFLASVLHHWGLDSRLTARTAFPVTLNGTYYVDSRTGELLYSGLDLVPGQPIYLRGANCRSVLQGIGNLALGQGCPGDWAINPNAFATVPTDPSTGDATRLGDASRNFVRGLGAWQMDLSLRREFPLFERLKLQFRAEAFNTFNHPNFGTINTNYCSPPGCMFGQVTATLAQSLGVLSPLYQMGGPRSMQFALRLAF